MRKAIIVAEWVIVAALLVVAAERAHWFYSEWMAVPTLEGGHVQVPPPPPAPTSVNERTSHPLLGIPVILLALFGPFYLGSKISTWFLHGREVMDIAMESWWGFPTFLLAMAAGVGFLLFGIALCVGL